MDHTFKCVLPIFLFTGNDKQSNIILCFEYRKRSKYVEMTILIIYYVNKMGNNNIIHLYGSWLELITAG